jgi:hypothetical protein
MSCNAAFLPSPFGGQAPLTFVVGDDDVEEGDEANLYIRSRTGYTGCALR